MSNADPDVQIKTTGFFPCFAAQMPNAVNAALRSSTMMCLFNSLFRAIAMINGAFLDPGEITTLTIPFHFGGGAEEAGNGAAVLRH